MSRTDPVVCTFLYSCLSLVMCTISSLVLVCTVYRPRPLIDFLKPLFSDFFKDDKGTKPLAPTGIEMNEIHQIGEAYSTPPGIEFTVHPGNKSKYWEGGGLGGCCNNGERMCLSLL